MRSTGETAVGGASEAPATSLWKERPSLNVPRGGLIGATSGTTYAIGGFTTGFGAELASVERLDAADESWDLVAPMPTGRGNPSAATVRGTVHVLGGFVRDNAVDIVEVYDPGSGRWRDGRPLPAARGGAGAAAIGDRIYVVGGFDADRATATVSVYDVGEDTWRDLRPMPTPRGLLKVAALDGHLYAIGGAADGQLFESAVERYDPVADAWQTVASLRTARGNPGVTTGDRHIFVVGGASAGGTLRSTEQYDPQADRWRPLTPLLAVGRASLSATLIASVDGAHDILVAFGGFEVAGGPPTASARVEALAVSAR